MKNTGKKLALGTIFAAAAGYVTGILTAPKSGKETRQDIKDATQRAVLESERQLKKLHTDLTMLINQSRDRAAKLKGDAKKQLDDAVERAKTSKEKVRTLLSAIHEGETEDKDLKKAIDEANKSIEHLKSYMKKDSKEESKESKESK